MISIILKNMALYILLIIYNSFFCQICNHIIHFTTERNDIIVLAAIISAIILLYVVCKTTQELNEHKS
jgi:hypothetical protein